MKLTDRILISTFPRSGHHLLIRIIDEYYGSRFLYYKRTSRNVEKTKKHVVYNKHADLTEFSPIPFKQVSLQKNHDYGLCRGQESNFEYLSDKFSKHIIQIRHPLESIVSFYYHRSKTKVLNRCWEDFAVDIMHWWKKFVEQWIECSLPELLIRYDRFVKDPFKTVIKVLELMGETKINKKKLSEILIAQNIYPRRNIKKAGIYDAKFFKELENMARGEIQMLDLKEDFV